MRYIEGITFSGTEDEGKEASLEFEDGALRYTHSGGYLGKVSGKFRFTAGQLRSLSEWAAETAEAMEEARWGTKN